MNLNREDFNVNVSCDVINGFFEDTNPANPISVEACDEHNGYYTLSGCTSRQCINNQPIYCHNQNCDEKQITTNTNVKVSFIMTTAFLLLS